MYTINKGQISFSVKAQNNHKSFVLGNRMGTGIGGKYKKSQEIFVCDI